MFFLTKAITLWRRYGPLIGSVARAHKDNVDARGSKHENKFSQTYQRGKQAREKMSMEESMQILNIERDVDKEALENRFLDMYKKNGPHSKSSPYLLERINAAYWVQCEEMRIERVDPHHQIYLDDHGKLVDRREENI